MHNKRMIEIYSKGCPACEEAIKLVNSITCPSCESKVLDIREDAAAKKAKSAGIRQVPAVVVDGDLNDCWTGDRLNEDELRSCGIGIPM